jgi:hypothetical protein
MTALPPLHNADTFSGQLSHREVIKIIKGCSKAAAHRVLHVRCWCFCGSASPVLELMYYWRRGARLDGGT